LSDKISAIPGIEAASFIGGAIPMISEDDRYFWIEGEPKPSGLTDMHMTLFYQVEPQYLEAMGISLKRGRFFTAQDDERSSRVAVIDEAFANKYFSKEDPIGQRIHLDLDDPPLQIVGVVNHVKQFGIDSDHEQSLQAQLYLPFRALPDDQLAARGVDVVYRSQGGSNVFNSVRHVVREQNSQNVISRPQTLDEVITGSISTQRFSMGLLGGFAVVALLLASLGIYGVISYLVGQRTHELGIRLALGARRIDIFRLVLGHGMKMAIAGVGIGLLAAFGLTRLMTKMLFGVSPTDGATFISISALLAFVALLACYMPARRATKVDPLVALRSE
jgi:predicted permease